MARGDADCNEALAVYRRIGDRRGEAWALQNLATIAFFRGDTVVAEERLNAAETMFEELGDWGGRSWTHALLAWTHFMDGKLDLAESLALEQLPESDAQGDRYVAGLLEMLLGNVALWRGQVTSAVERSRGAVSRFRTMGDPWAIGQAMGIELRALAAAGEVEEALTRLESETAMGQAGTPLHILRGADPRARRRSGRPAGCAAPAGCGGALEPAGRP